MAGTQVLTYTVNVKDNFNTTLNKLSNAINKIDVSFNKLSSSLDKNTDKVCRNLDRISQKMNILGMNTTNTFSHINNTLTSQFEQMNRQQERSVSRMEQRYRQMVENINRDLRRIEFPNQPNDTNPNQPSQPNQNYNFLGSSGLETLLRNVFSGNFSSLLGKLGMLGVVGTGILTATKLIDTNMNLGFDLLNKVTGNMFSMEGIQNALEDAMSFESGRASLGVFFGNKADDTYKMATKVANETFASEKDTISIASKLGQVGVNMTDAQMKSILGVAATRPTVSIDHIGLAIQEAIDGRISMLKNYGINNYKLQDYYKYLQKNDKSQANALKGALNKKGTAGDAQKYFDLVVSYIDSPFSHMAGYADEYTKTLSGKLDRLSGLFDRAKAEIVGFDTETGKVRDNSFMDKFGEAIDTLKTKLEQPETIEFMKRISEALGTLATGLSDAFIKLINGVDLNKLADSISKVVNVVADALNKLIDSGVLDELIDKLPTLIEQILKFKGMELENKAQVGIDIANGDFKKAGEDWFTGNEKKYANVLFPNTDESMIDNGIGLLNSGFKMGARIANPALIANDIMNLFNSSDEETVSDSDLMLMLDNGEFKNMSKNDVESVRRYVLSDDESKYSISTINVYANSFDEFINSLPQARNNRNGG